MKLATLFSGGKDSTYASYLAELSGNQIEFLVTVMPLRDDSYMYHSINVQLTRYQAIALNKRHILTKSSGCKESELEDLRRILEDLDIDGVVSGAIASKYQKSRIDNICKELNLHHFSPLWGKCRLELLNEMITRAHMSIIVTEVAALGLDKNWLGKQLNKPMLEKLIVLNQKYGIDLCGEGGEYETLVLDAPWFNKKIKILDASFRWDDFHGTYLINKAKLVEKT